MTSFLVYFTVKNHLSPLKGYYVVMLVHNYQAEVLKVACESIRVV